MTAPAVSFAAQSLLECEHGVPVSASDLVGP